jgi:cell division protein FtsN
MKKNKKKDPDFKKPFLVLPRTRIAGWGVVIFFALAWMFALGLLVGRGTAPVKFDIDKLQPKLQVPGIEAAKPETDETPTDSELVKDKTKLEFYERLPENPENAKTADIPQTKVVRQKVEPEPNAKAPETKPEKSRPVEASRPPKVGPSNESAAAGKIYTIQVASVKNAADADRLVAKLEKSGFPAYRSIGKVPGKGIWFRVRVGQYANRNEARSILEKLKKEGMKPIVVAK